MDVRDKVVAITGAARGLGQEFATQPGCAPAPGLSPATSTTAPRRSTWSSRPDRKGVGVKLDVTDAGSARAMVEAAVQAFGRLDALINNAALYGALHGGRFDAIDEAEWDAAMAVNVKGIWNCCKAAVPAMRKARRRQHRQHRLARRDLRHALRAALHDLEGGRDRADPRPGARSSAATASGSMRWRRARSSPRERANFSATSSTARWTRSRPGQTIQRNLMPAGSRRHGACGWSPTPAVSSPARPSRSMAAP